MDFNRWLQSRLTAHGFACGGIDGEIGPVTLAALEAFQSAKGLSVSGKADPQTVAALKLSSSSISPAVKTQIPDRNTEPVETYGPSGKIWPRQRDCMSFYGPVGQNQVTIEIPYEMRITWGNRPIVRKMTLHKLVAPSALRVLERAALRFSASERESLGIDKFGGSLNVRRMRGGTAYSMHSWGIAIDFDPERNGLHVKSPQARLSRDDASEWWALWESEGWLSLGRSRDFDWMHVQAARL